MRILFILLFLTSCSTYVGDISKYEQPLPKWQNVLERQPIVAGHDKPTYGAMAEAHEHCNGMMVYTKDEVDNWQTPLESEKRKKGDCDDYSICKYYALRAAGFQAKDLNIAVIDNFMGVHEVLFVKLEGKEYVLDNNIPRPLPMSEYTRNLKVIYSFNENGVRVWK